MANNPHVPLSLAELPQQRISLVTELRPAPTDFTFQVGYGGFAPASVMPKQRVPRSPTYLFQAEWSDSPANGAVNAYYLQARRRHWLLWIRYLDDGDYPWTWHWVLIGYCERRGVDERTAAMHLLLEYWTYAADDSLCGSDPYEWINEAAFLSVSDVEAIVRELRFRSE